MTLPHRDMCTYDCIICCTGGESTLATCNALLSDGVSYDVANDLPDQRAALVEFYTATGGAYWTTSVLTEGLRSEIDSFEAYLTTLAAEEDSSSFNVSALSTEYQEIFAAVDSLSVNCTIQRTLQIVQLLVKAEWNTASTRLIPCTAVPAAHAAMQSATAADMP